MIPFLELIYLFLPGYLANASPPIIAKLPLLRRWNTPLDFGKSWNGTKLLGNNKTVRGVVMGVLLGGLAFVVQKYWLSAVITTPHILYTSLPWWYGFLFALGAILVGDCGESLLKRRLGVAPGKPWLPFDQLDYTVGAFLLTFWLWWPGWPSFLLLLLFNAALTVSSHIIGHLLHINKDII